MKLSCLAIIATLATATVSAIECTEEQFLAYSKLDETPYREACPSLFLEGAGAFKVSNLGTLNAASLKKLETCKAKTCLTKLGNYSDVTPDCSVNGFNLRSMVTVTIQLCEAFNAGPVSVETAKTMFKDIEKSYNDAFGSFEGDDGSEEAGSSSVSVSDGKSGNTTEKVTPTTTKPADVPTPAPTPKSDATALSPAAAAAVTTAALLALSFTL